MPPVERADAEAVAGQHQPFAAAVPQGQGELPPQPLEHPFLAILPEMGDHLRVAVGAEAVAARLQLGLFLGVVEEFTVVDDVNGSVLISDRLPAVRQADDAEPARS
jgi:hypothetical protein